MSNAPARDLGQEALHGDLDVAAAAPSEPEAGLRVVEVVLLLELEEEHAGLNQDLGQIVGVEVNVEAIGRRILYDEEFLRSKGLGEAVIDVEDRDELRLELVDDPLAF